MGGAALSPELGTQVAGVGSQVGSGRDYFLFFLPSLFLFPASFLVFPFPHFPSFLSTVLPFLCFPQFELLFFPAMCALLPQFLTCHVHRKPEAAVFKGHLARLVFGWHLGTLPLKHSLSDGLFCPSGALNTCFLLGIWQFGHWDRSLGRHDQLPRKALNPEYS